MEQRYDPAVPIDKLIEHPANPRRGDEAAIAESIKAHGFYGTAVVQESTHHILIGNSRTRAARRQGLDTVPVLWVDVDDEQALRLLLVDNRTSDRAAYDDRTLAQLLAELETFDGTGYDGTDLGKLLAQLEPQPVVELGGQFDRSAERQCPYCEARWYDTSSGPVRC